MYIRNNKGFSLVETVIYIGLMIVLLASLMYSIYQSSMSYKSLQTTRDVEESAISIIESIQQSASNATSIDGNNTLFNNASGSIAFMSNGTTTKIYLSGNRVYLDENGVINPLSLSDVDVTNLTLRPMPSGIKIELTINDINFYNSANINKHD